MPHRVNAKGDIGNAKRFSDSYDMDNIYLTEEGWVYRHYKTDKAAAEPRWWDEIIVAGQVIPGDMIDGVINDFVEETNPPKLGTVATPTFQDGDSYEDYRYSDHQNAPDKIVVDPTPTAFEQVAWEAINVASAEEGDNESQIPDGWGGTSTPEYPG